MKRVQLKPYLVLPFLLTIIFSCTKEKEDPVIPNQEELITTLIYTLVDTISNDTVVFSFRDLDGDGGDLPVITNGILLANRNYEGSIKLYNETITPMEDISAEVLEEGEDHQFFYIIDEADAVITYNDSDLNENPIGLNTICSTGLISEGTLTIVLRHEPDKSAPGVAEGDIENAGGETDIEVSFVMSIQ